MELMLLAAVVALIVVVGSWWFFARQSRESGSFRLRGVLSVLFGNGPFSVMFLDEPRNDQEDRGTLEGLPALSDRYCSLRLSAVLGSLQRLLAS